MGQSKLILFLSNYGSKYGSLLVSFSLVLFVLFLDYKVGFIYLLTLVISYGITTLIRFFYFKERPIPIVHTSSISKIRSSSFPSAHVQRAVINTYFLFIVVNFSLIVTFVLSVMVGFSRYFKKRHDIYDIGAGYIIGLILVFLIETLVF